MTAFGSPTKALGTCIVSTLTMLTVPSQTPAEIVIHEPGFAVDVLLDQIDGVVPRLEAIRNPEYGLGVVAASVDEDTGILSVLRLSQGQFEVLSTLGGFQIGDSRVFSTRFDWTGLFDHSLYLTVAESSGGNQSTKLVRVFPDGTAEVIWHLGGANSLGFVFDFTLGTAGYLSGAYLEDLDGGSGTALWHMDEEFDTQELDSNLLPPGRNDLDIRGMEFDTTGTYGWLLTMADSDPNIDNKTAIYQLHPDLSWSELTAVVDTDTRFYTDMVISPGGAFGQRLYVSDTVSDTVMIVDADTGEHEVFASGFEFWWDQSNWQSYGSITIGSEGNTLYAADNNGIYRIRPVGDVPGPTIIMREPKVAAGGVHTNLSGVSSERILFNEAVLFDEDDLAVVDSLDQPVPFDVAGSNSPFMLISFGQPLLDDIYTITIADTVVSADDNTPIDGDNDGINGGDAVITMEHRCRTDVNNDSIVNADDLFELLGAWGPCP